MRQSAYETEAAGLERALLVSLVTDEVKRSGADPEHSLEELASLAETAGVEVIGSVMQNLDSPDNKYYVGKGKAQEIRDIALRDGATTAIFD